MSLVLSLKAGEDFFVGEELFEVTEVNGEVDFMLRRVATGKVMRVTDEHALEVLPDVFVSAGSRPPTSSARVTIDAPREVLIVRGSKKRQGDRG